MLMVCGMCVFCLHLICGYFYPYIYIYVYIWGLTKLGVPYWGPYDKGILLFGALF